MLVVLAAVFVVATLRLMARLDDGGGGGPSGGSVGEGDTILPVGTRFTRCYRGTGRMCVVDGDTIRVQNQPIRLLGIDTPETRNYGCGEEKMLGDRATARLLALLNSGGSVRLRRDRLEDDRDVYDRKLRYVLIDGEDVGRILVTEGLARNYGAGRRDWC